MQRVKRWTKKAVGHPEHDIPVISVGDWAREYRMNPVEFFVTYIKSLFPFFQWIGNYSTCSGSHLPLKGELINDGLDIGWATGDIIAGLTVGIVLVPQSMSYAKIASLSPEYGTMVIALRPSGH